MHVKGIVNSWAQIMKMKRAAHPPTIGLCILSTFCFMTIFVNNQDFYDLCIFLDL